MTQQGSVYIVCPSMRGLSPRMHRNVDELRDRLRAKGIETPPPEISDASPLYFARSLMADHFMSSGCALMYSFDDDTELKPIDGVRLCEVILNGDADFVGAAYRTRRVNWKALRAAAKRDDLTDEEVWEDGVHSYCQQMTADALTNKRLRGFVYEEHRFVEHDWVGGGLFLMSRRCVSSLLEAFPKMLLFENFVSDEGIFQSDDIVIGGRWKSIGGTSYVDIDAKTIHWGSIGFGCAYGRHLEEQGYSFTEATPAVFDIDTRVQPAAVKNARRSVAHVGVLLRHAREKAGLLASEVAERLGKPTSYVHLVEQGGISPDPMLAAKWRSIVLPDATHGTSG